MSTKSKLQDTERDLARGLATWEGLPEKSKELFRLKDQLEETTGPEEVVISREIHHKARKAHGNTPPSDEKKTDTPDDAAANNNPPRIRSRKRSINR